MDNQDKNSAIAALIARKRKLIELRDNTQLKLSRKQNQEFEGEDNIPSSPPSNEPRSISPPPFSPPINHKFLVSGHTHMECDSDHAIIEKAKKKTQMKINHLNDWVQLVRTCKVTKPFKVVVMTLNDFLDFADLKSKKGPFSIKKVDVSGNKFLWQPIKWLQYSSNCIGTLLYKESLDTEAPFISVNFKKKGTKNTQLFTLNPISREPLPISAEKKKDLMDVIELIDDAFKDFFMKIKSNGDVSALLDPDLEEINPDLDNV